MSGFDFRGSLVCPETENYQNIEVLIFLISLIRSCSTLFAPHCTRYGYLTGQHQEMMVPDNLIFKEHKKV